MGIPQSRWHSKAGQSYVLISRTSQVNDESGDRPCLKNLKLLGRQVWEVGDVQLSQVQGFYRSKPPPTALFKNQPLDGLEVGSDLAHSGQPSGSCIFALAGSSERSPKGSPM